MAGADSHSMPGENFGGTWWDKVFFGNAARKCSHDTDSVRRLWERLNPVTCFFDQFLEVGWGLG